MFANCPPDFFIPITLSTLSTVISVYFGIRFIKKRIVEILDRELKEVLPKDIQNITRKSA